MAIFITAENENETFTAIVNLRDCVRTSICFLRTMESNDTHRDRTNVYGINSQDG